MQFLSHFKVFLIFTICYFSFVKTNFTNFQKIYVANINVKELQGSISFIHDKKIDPATIKVHLNGSSISSNGLQWEIRHLPTLYIYGKESNYCSNLVANSKLLYNLTDKHGILTTRGVYVSEDFSLTNNENSIMGSSIVIKNQTHTIACATILPAKNNNTIYFTKLNQKLGGEIYFLEYDNKTLAMGFVYGLNSKYFNLPIDWNLVYFNNNSIIHNQDEFLTSSKPCSYEEKQNCPIGELGIYSNFLFAFEANHSWSSMYHFRHIFSDLKIQQLHLDNKNIKYGIKIQNVAKRNYFSHTFLLQQVIFP